MSFYAFYPPGAAGSANASVGINNTPAPTSSTEIGFIDSLGNLQPVTDANPLPVTDASPVLPPDAATASNQVLQIAEETAIKVAVESLDIKTVIVDTNNVSVTSTVGLTDTELRATPVAVSGPLTDAELRASAVPVSLAAVPLPTGAATEAKQDAQIVQETAIKVAVESIDSKTITVDTGNVTIVSTVGLTDTELRATPVPVSGPLTDTQLRATPVPVSGTVSTGGLTDAELRASPVPVSLTSTTITGSVAVTGPLTDTQLRATPVPVSGTVSTGGLTDAELRATPVPVSGTVTSNIGTTGGLALEATLGAFSAKSAAGFVPEAFDETVLTYVGATTRIDTVEYKLAGSTVATLTLSYDGSDRLDGVVKT